MIPKSLFLTPLESCCYNKVNVWDMSVPELSPYKLPFFADDALLFIRNKKVDVEHVRDILSEFEAASGQKINLAKSSLFFSTNTSREQKLLFGNILGMQTVDKLDNYLCLPLYVGKKKLIPFDFY